MRMHWIALQNYLLFTGKTTKHQFIKISRIYKVLFITSVSIPKKQLLKDTPFEEIYSQHSNIWGVLTDAIPKEKQKEVIQKVLTDKSLIQCTIYFRFYLFQAMKKVGLADEYIEQLIGSLARYDSQRFDHF